ncbi:hypothetical protein Patl1_14362 [Pistacia atlantica]|uniref:Uncharacterized protein n=1 Tax=Pistacia atlantica TaxID=434234 RepID=A0ACC1AWG8_9ROSI|nr:hypothetical protein Patl1_14362 [Pistacia atlantica]
MAKLKHFFFFFFFFVLLISSCEGALASKVNIVRVGVILDLNSSVGRIAQRDSQNDVVGAALAALDLMKNEKVHEIIGPQKSEEAQFVIDLGRKTNVPVVSFSATSPSLSPTKNSFALPMTIPFK